MSAVYPLFRSRSRKSASSPSPCSPTISPQTVTTVPVGNKEKTPTDVKTAIKDSPQVSPSTSDGALNDFMVTSPEYAHIREGQQEAEAEFEHIVEESNAFAEEEELVPLPKLLQLGEETGTANVDAM